MRGSKIRTQKERNFEIVEEMMDEEKGKEYMRLFAKWWMLVLGLVCVSIIAIRIVTL